MSNRDKKEGCLILDLEAFEPETISLEELMVQESIKAKLDEDEDDDWGFGREDWDEEAFMEFDIEDNRVYEPDVWDGVWEDMEAMEYDK